MTTLLSTQSTRKFTQRLEQDNIPIQRRTLRVLQVNVGKLCNQACHHCHVEAGPQRTEIMSRTTIERLLELLVNAPQVHTVDITGGAPELNPHFRWFVESVRAMGKQVIDRCNLTVLFEPGQEDIASFLAQQQVQVVASLPCYLAENVDKQRGKGVFDKSVRALQLLNRLGYGQPESGLELNLVYNPVGAHLPPAQKKLEQDYKQRLDDAFGIRFNHLFTITNMPINRFADFLRREDKLDDYMQLLIDNFNAQAALNVMCTELVSVGWDGKLYDCDFNQMLEIPVSSSQKTIWQIDRLDDLVGDIALADHCYGCTAGAGSSCGGALL